VCIIVHVLLCVCVCVYECTIVCEFIIVCVCIIACVCVCVCVSIIVRLLCVLKVFHSLSYHSKSPKHAVPVQFDKDLVVSTAYFSCKNIFFTKTCAGRIRSYLSRMVAKLT
jgi:hypothetical protein